MPDSLIEAWRVTGFGLAVALWIFVLPQLFGHAPARNFAFRKTSSIEFSFLALITFLGVGLRFLFIEEFQAGQLTSDEALMSIWYTSGIVRGESVGATQIVFAGALDLWHRFFPFTPFWSRCLSAVIGLLGVIFLFFGVARFVGTRVAAWTAALLAISLYGIYWSKTSMEIYWTLFVPPLVLFLISTRHGRFYGFVAFLSGFFAGAGLFTYPGTLLVFAAVVLGGVLGWIAHNAGRHPHIWRESLRRFFERASPYFFCAGFAIAFSLCVYLHLTVYGIQGSALFVGGGWFTLSLAAVLSNLEFILSDLFVEGRSWYLPYRHAPFVEPFIWPFVVLGVRSFWMRYPSWQGRTVIYAMPILLLLAAFTGPYPGMRRAVGLLPFLYFFCALGIVSLLESLAGACPRREEPRFRWLTWRCIGKGTVLGLMVLALTHSLYYQIGYGRRITGSNFGHGFGVDRVAYEELMDLLHERQVVMDLPNEKVYFDKRLYRSYPLLAGRYNPRLRTENRVHFLDDPKDPFVRDLAQRRNWVLIAWDASKVLQHLKNLGVCLLLDKGKTHRSMPFLAFSEPFPTSDPGRACRFADEIARDLDNSVLLGYLHQEERVRHQVRCQGPYCDRSRPDFLYTRDGEVTFLLRFPERKSSPGGYELRIYVRYPEPRRKSRIFVDERFVGPLDSDVVDASGLARYRLPESIDSKGVVIHVAIRPAAEPERLGWDVERAAVEWVSHDDAMPAGGIPRRKPASQSRIN